MSFDEWLFNVCEYLASRSRSKERDEQYFYERIDLGDARCQFIDKVDPCDFEFYLKY